VLYGEDINTGSRISGLTKNLRAPQAGRILNVGNCESTHCGVGFGLMMAGVPAILFVKQLDFMLLGIDHFVSTYNVVRSHPHLDDLGSFTIITIVCDQGWQGPQSSFNALGDLWSLARVPGYSITNAQDTRHVLERLLPSPGFRIIALSQRLFSLISVSSLGQLAEHRASTRAGPIDADAGCHLVRKGRGQPVASVRRYQLLRSVRTVRPG